MSPMRRAARLAESWSRVLGGQPMTFGVAHMKPRRCNPSMTTTNCKRRSECTAKVCKTSKLELKANQLRSKSLTHSTVRNKIYAAQKDSKIYTSIHTYIHTYRQTDTNSMHRNENGKISLYFTTVVKQLMICKRTFCLTQSCYRLHGCLLLHRLQP